MFVVNIPTFGLFFPLQTTYENFRYRYTSRENPYDKGIVGNFMEIFFSSIPVSKNNFRAKVQKKSMTRTHSVSARCSNLENWKMEQREAMWEEAMGMGSRGSNRITLANGDDMIGNGHSNPVM